jgi:hypothetical protein
MRDDHARTGAYREAITAAAQGKVIIDLGTGALALLAIFAAEAGAKHVYAIEVQPVAAAAARRTINEAGLSNRCNARLLHRCLGCWHWRSASRGAYLDARRAGRLTLFLLKCVRLSLLRHAHTAPAQEKVGRGRVIPHSVLQRAEHKRWVEAESLEL